MQKTYHFTFPQLRWNLLPSPNPYNKCDKIVDFYKAHQLNSTKNSNSCLGKSYSWSVTEKGQPHTVSCECSAEILGLGELRIESLTDKKYTHKIFQESSEVDLKTGNVSLSPLFGGVYEIQLPIPD